MSWNRIQSAVTAATGSAITSQSVAYGTNLSQGTALIAAVATSTQTGASTSPYATVTTVKDGAGNSFTLIGRESFPSGTDVLTDVSLWALATPAGDVGTKPTITATLLTGTANMGILVQEVSGIQAVADGTLGATGGTGGSSTGSPSYTSTASGEYLVSVYGDDGGPVTWTKPSALTSDANSVNTNGDSNVALAYGNSTDTAESGSWTLSGATGVDWGTLLVAFKLTPGISTRPLVVSQAVNRASTY